MVVIGFLPGLGAGVPSACCSAVIIRKLRSISTRPGETS